MTDKAKRFKRWHSF